MKHSTALQLITDEIARLKKLQYKWLTVKRCEDYQTNKVVENVIEGYSKDISKLEKSFEVLSNEEQVAGCKMCEHYKKLKTYRCCPYCSKELHP